MSLGYLEIFIVVPPDTQFQPNVSKDGAPGLGPMSELGQAERLR